MLQNSVSEQEKNMSTIWLNRFIYVKLLQYSLINIRYSVTAITSRFHRGDRGSTPRIGVFFFPLGRTNLSGMFIYNLNYQQNTIQKQSFSSFGMKIVFGQDRMRYTFGEACFISAGRNRRSLFI